MTEQNREAYPIQWNAPAADAGHSPWQGPRPDAQLPAGDQAGSGAPMAAQAGAPQTTAPQNGAPQGAGLGNPWGQAPQADQAQVGQAQVGQAQVGWAGSASSGETAQEISQSHPQDAGFGWSGANGSTVFEAPDRADHAPRQQEQNGQQFEQSHEPADQGHAPVQDAPQPSAVQHEVEQNGCRAQGYVSSGYVSSPSASYESAAPAAPQSVEQPYAQPASYASAPVSGSTGTGEQWGQTYASAPPQVVGQHDDLPEDSLTIGRSRDNSIVLDDMLVSRRHVVITADDEGLLLRDLGSRNGTFVNGRRVEQTHLHEEDRIGIGASTFEVRDGWLVSV